jgi:hypothetical protein
MRFGDPFGDPKGLPFFLKKILQIKKLLLPM